MHVGKSRLGMMDVNGGSFFMVFFCVFDFLGIARSECQRPDQKRVENSAASSIRLRASEPQPWRARGLPTGVQSLSDAGLSSVGECGLVTSTSLLLLPWLLTAPTSVVTKLSVDVEVSLATLSPSPFCCSCCFFFCCLCLLLSAMARWRRPAATAYSGVFRMCSSRASAARSSHSAFVAADSACHIRDAT